MENVEATNQKYPSKKNVLVFKKPSVVSPNSRQFIFTNRSEESLIKSPKHSLAPLWA